MPKESLQKIGATVYVPMDLAINTELSYDLNNNLLGSFSSTEANVEPPFVRKTI